ncbi:hypothetical protein [Arsenicicoccus dermatophilus]|uniref:hypothetical protein n=1 Tax=Arsenicicoccus dermatophilus TaxID=1076331 RepID=UPI001F4CAB6D|nr:hypothetical protein [Arsenicicoccus dermatophilus]MCH8614091.1 hypothetical protein [Arsenicicoccus dermatophilus]
MGSREVVPLSVATVDLLREPCRGCVRWLRDPVEAHAGQERRSTPRQRAWVAEVTREWGPPGVLVREGDRTQAHVVLAPPAYVPRALLPATAPIGQDAVLLLSLSSAGRSHSRVAVQALSRDLVRRRVRAVEAYGGPETVPGCLHLPSGPVAADPAPAGGPVPVPGRRPRSDGPWPSPDLCRVPTRLLLDLGFEVVREHPTVPRLRLDMRSLAMVVDQLGARLSRWSPAHATAPATTWGHGRAPAWDPRLGQER